MSETVRIAISLALGFSWCLWVAVLWWKKRPSLSIKSGQSLVVYASQTGQAQASANQYQASLNNAIVLPLNKLKQHHLQTADEIHFYLSTYGDGEAPDNGRGFFQLLNRASQEILTSMKFSVTAFGDSRYPQFCAFGKQVNHALLQMGATALADIRFVDANSAQSQQNDPTSYTEAHIIEIQHLNPNSQSPGLYLLKLKAPNLQWQAGDLLDILPPEGNGLAAARTYSIASASSHLVTNQTASLLVRLHLKPNGNFGLASGFLTQDCKVGSKVNVKVRANPSCQLSTEQQPLLLIGAGSGLAGLIGHIEQRSHCDNAGPIWLIYGEREPEHDEHLADLLLKWQEAKVLQRVDKTFSRHQTSPKYVQDVITEQMLAIKEFIGEQGHIYVCGSLSGMGNTVNKALEQIFGRDGLKSLSQQSRYHRDLY